METNPAKTTIPVQRGRLAEPLPSGCLAALVEVVVEEVGGPEHPQRAPAAAAQQGGDAWGPEEAWHRVLQAAS